MAEPEPLALGSGEAVAFTRAAPHKDPDANEDGVGVFPVRSSGGLLAVADGVGGGPKGASASKAVLEALWDTTLDAPAEGSMRSAILDGLEQANRRILEARNGAATTLVCAEIAGTTLRPYHAGDSALLVVGGGGKVKVQTVPHSPVGYAVEAGMLDEEEALHHALRHVISNAVGIEDMRIEIGSTVELAPRDTVVLASDGVLDNLGVAELAALVRRGPLLEAAHEVVGLCTERMRSPQADLPSKSDDLGLVLYRPRRG